MSGWLVLGVHQGTSIRVSLMGLEFGDELVGAVPDADQSHDSVFMVTDKHCLTI